VGTTRCAVTAGALLTTLLVAACGCGTAAGTAATPPPSAAAEVPSATTAAPAATTRGPSSAVAPRAAAAHRVVVLDPGHNGGNAGHPEIIDRPVPDGAGGTKPCNTVGTQTAAGYAEHAFTWDVALRTRDLLTAAGVRVVLTRPDDTGVGPCVDERAAIGNRPGVAAVVSIHADGAPADGHGFHVNQDSRIPDGATAATQQRSIALGRAIHDALVASSGLVPSTYIGQDGYYYRSDLAGLNLATNPATFLELGNMKNAGDAALQSSPAGRQRIAAAVAAGILAFLGRA
jgi:N-acetylmuramoyl-L-alanine amidase